MKMKVIIHKAEEGGYWAEVPAIPGCASQGETMEELLDNVRESIEGCMSTRSQNERQYERWENLSTGGRIYTRDVQGKSGWKARYLKEVDAADRTLRFWQEIYDERGKLVEIHEKFPVDKGHRKI